MSCVQRGDAAVPAELVYVSNEHSGDVSVIDSATDTEITRFPVGKRPRGLKVSRDGSTLYVALSSSSKEAEATATQTGRGVDGIAVVDVRSRRTTRVLPSGRAPETFDLSADETKLFAANEESGETTVVDTRDGRVLAVLQVGVGPEGVATRPDGGVVYVTSETDNLVTVIDAVRPRVLLHVTTGARPRSVAFTPDSRWAFVANEGSGELTIIDARRHRGAGKVHLGGGMKPMGTVMSEDGNRLFVTTGRAGAVAVVDVGTRKVLQLVRDVGSRPWGIGRTRHGDKLYTANGPSDDVTVLHGATGTPIRRVRVGAFPWGVAIGRRVPVQTRVSQQAPHAEQTFTGSSQR